MTGASGPKVGQVVARALAAVHSLTGVDAQPGAHTHRVADLREIADWGALLEGVEGIVHFAALHAPHRDTHSRAEFQAVNVEASARLIDAARRAGVRKFVFASTTSVYGRAMRTAERAAWVTELLPPEPEDIYDETKLAAEALCREAFSADFQTVALRFSRCFSEPVPMMALYRLYRGVDARDVAEAFRLAVERPMPRFEIYNISGGTPFCEADCEALWRDAVGVLQMRVPPLVEAFRRRGWSLPDRIDRVYVAAKAQRELEWQARFGWEAVVEGR